MEDWCMNNPTTVNMNMKKEYIMIILFNFSLIVAFLMGLFS